MGREKAFVALHGRPLIETVIARLAPQVCALAINANGEAARFLAFGLPVVPDGVADGGPLVGIVSGLAWARRQEADAAVFAPCDGPFLPRDLVARLAGTLSSASAEATTPGISPPLPARAGMGVRPAVVVSPLGTEPLFSLWPVAIIDELSALLVAGVASPRAALLALRARSVPWPDAAPFANLNTPDDLAAASVLD